jgi:hypothetical protein
MPSTSPVAAIEPIRAERGVSALVAGDPVADAVIAYTAADRRRRNASAWACALLGRGCMSRVFQHIVDGCHTALLGRSLDLDDSCLVRLVRVRCHRGDHALGPLIEAKMRIEELLGLAPATATDDPSPAARFRPLGEGRQSYNARLVALFNRLRDESEQPAALLLESVQNADPDTLELLERMVKTPSWMRLPLVLEFRSPPLENEAKRLLDAVERFGGTDCVFRSETWLEQKPGTEPPPASACVASNSLAPEVRRVLRAGAVLGSHFSVDSVAEVLESDPPDGTRPRRSCRSRSWLAPVYARNDSFGARKKSP